MRAVIGRMKFPSGLIQLIIVVEQTHITQESHDVSPMSEDKQKEEDYRLRLQKELVSRDGHG